MRVMWCSPLLPLLIICLVAGCSSWQEEQVANLPTPEVTVTLVPSKSAIVGQVFSGSAQPLANTPVKLAAVVWNAERTDGAVILDASHGPATTTRSDGAFLFSGLEPGDYALVVGDVFGKHVIVSEDNGKMKVFAATSDKVTNIGRLIVNLPQ